MKAVAFRAGRRMAADEEAKDGSPVRSVHDELTHHAAVMGRVAMALLGAGGAEGADATHVEQVLENVAREAGAKRRSNEATEVRPLAWLLGLVRVASAVQLSKLPRRTAKP